jgi:hypothetical protein
MASWAIDYPLFSFVEKAAFFFSCRHHQAGCWLPLCGTAGGRGLARERAVGEWVGDILQLSWHYGPVD